MTIVFKEFNLKYFTQRFESSDKKSFATYIHTKSLEH